MRRLLPQPCEFQTWDAVRCLTSLSADDLGDKDEGDLSKCANDAEPGGVLSAEKQQDILKSLNDLQGRNDKRDMDFKVMRACRD